MEYIEREAAKEAIRAKFLSLLDRYEINEVLNALPAADVRPMVRGRWVGIDEFLHEDWECDCCGEQICGNANIPEEIRFCPYCGANMKEEE